MIRRKFSPPAGGKRKTRVPIITDPTFYMLAIPGAIALGLAKGGFTGAGQMATPMLAMILPPLEAAAIMLPLLITQDLYAVWVYRKNFDRRILSIMLPGAMAGILVASLVASYVSDAAVRVFIGSVSILFVLYTWVGPKRIADGRPTENIPAGVFWGAMSGFTSTICQAGGPPFQMYVLRQHLAKMAFVGTTAVFFCVLNWVKVVPYLALGQFSVKGFLTSLVLMPLAFASSQVGFWLVRVTPQERFFKIITTIMLVLSIELTRQGAVQLWWR